MKAALFGQKNNKRNEEKQGARSGKKIEMVLISLFLTFFIIMITVQTVMFHPDIKSMFFLEKVEGSPLNSEMALFIPCKMELRLINMGYCKDLKVLVNGIEIDSFQEKSVMLDLKDGDVVELDGNAVHVTAQVEISAVSMNIKELLGKRIVVTDGIISVAAVSIDKYGKCKAFAM